MNKLETEVVQTPIRKQEECAKFIIEDTYIPFVFNDVFEEIGISHVFSFWAKSEHNGLISVSGQKYQTTQTWKKYVIIINPYDENLRLFFDEPGIYYMYNSQLEKGDYATDYRPAVEDVKKDVLDAKTIAIQTNEMFKWIVSSAESSSEFTLTDRMANLIAETISLNGDVKVSGDMIVDGSLTTEKFAVKSITADKIDVDDLFAQNIKATGTINGVKLVGVELEVGSALTIDKNGKITINYTGESEGVEYFSVIDAGKKYNSSITRYGFYSEHEEDNGNMFVTGISYASIYLYEQDEYGQMTRLVMLSPGHVEAHNFTAHDSLQVGSLFVTSEYYEAKLYAPRIILETSQGTWKPYFSPGDSIAVRWRGAATVTGSGKTLVYCIPLTKPAVGCSGVTVTTDGGFICRQNDKYCYGSGSETQSKAVSSHSAGVNGDSHVRITTTMSNNTNVTNNDAIAIDASVTITFV